MGKVGIINPGEMGISIAASMQVAGQAVYWARDGRSAATRRRAHEQQLQPVASIAELCALCDVILCVCPPHAAEDVAAAVIKAGYAGLYCDGNAIAPQKAQAIAQRMLAAGIDFVDGSIIGPPAWKAGTTRFYLSGAPAGRIADLFAGSVTDAIVVGEEIGKASALKMVFAAQTKGFTALISAIQALAEKLGVREDLDREWAMRDPDSVEQKRSQVRNVTAKAWRFTGEMQEIAATFEVAGLSPGFFLAAHDVYQRMAAFKDADETPPLEDVLAAMLDDPA